VSSTADQAGSSAGARGLAERLGIAPGALVLEIGHDDDCDEQLRDEVAARTGSDLLADDTDEVVDVVLLWFRDGDGDLVDVLVDALGPLADVGVVWLLTPKAGRDGHVEPSEIQESARTAGLQQTSNLSVGQDWSGVRLATPRGVRGRR
jgi:hypothetical protein